jgi:hypothetical protein
MTAGALRQRQIMAAAKEGEVSPFVNDLDVPHCQFQGDPGIWLRRSRSILEPLRPSDSEAPCRASPRG